MGDRSEYLSWSEEPFGKKPWSNQRSGGREMHFTTVEGGKTKKDSTGGGGGRKKICRPKQVAQKDWVKPMGREIQYWMGRVREREYRSEKIVSWAGVVFRSVVQEKSVKKLVAPERELIKREEEKLRFKRKGSKRGPQ